MTRAPNGFKNASIQPTAPGNPGPMSVSVIVATAAAASTSPAGLSINNSTAMRSPSRRATIRPASQLHRPGKYVFYQTDTTGRLEHPFATANPRSVP